ncbi:MAG: hypothetical protein RL576_1317 [Actinomycetota bacterium]
MGAVHCIKEREVNSVSSSDNANLVPAPTAIAVLEHVVRSIVDNPDAVHVDAREDDDKVFLEVRVGEGDLGRVIGRRGRTVFAQ